MAKKNKKKKSQPTTLSKKKAKKKVQKPSGLSRKAARKKGLDFECIIARSIRHIFPDVDRQLESQVSLSGKGIDLRGCDPYKVQCKRNRLYASIIKIEEVVKSRDEDIPLLVTKGDNKKAIAALYWTDFVKMLEKIASLETQIVQLGIIEAEGGADKLMDKMEQANIAIHSKDPAAITSEMLEDVEQLSPPIVDQSGFVEGAIKQLSAAAESIADQALAEEVDSYEPTDEFKEVHKKLYQVEPSHVIDADDLI